MFLGFTFMVPNLVSKENALVPLNGQFLSHCAWPPPDGVRSVHTGVNYDIDTS